MNDQNDLTDVEAEFLTNDWIDEPSRIAEDWDNESTGVLEDWMEEPLERLKDLDDEGRMREILVGQGFNPDYRVTGSLTPKLIDAYLRRVKKVTPFYYLYMRDLTTGRYFFKQVPLEHPNIYRAYVGLVDRGDSFTWPLAQLNQVPLIKVSQYHLHIENYRENLDLIQLVKEFRAQGHLPFYIVELPENKDYTIYRTLGCEWVVERVKKMD